MKEIEREQRPREKALRFGVQSVSDEELLCLMIGSGSSRSSVLRISRQVLQATDHLCRLFDVHLSELTSIEGIGDAKALSLMASIELARRALRVRAYRKTIRSAQDVSDWLQAEYGGAAQENFIALFLDSKGKMIAHKVLGIGTLNQSVIHPRDIFREAYLCKANSILFAHNHPSGDPSPSLSDLETTRQLVDAARIAGIPILDHVIVAHSDSFSFQQHGLLEGKNETPEPEASEEDNWFPYALWNARQLPDDPNELPPVQNRPENMQDRKEAGAGLDVSSCPGKETIHTEDSMLPVQRSSKGDPDIPWHPGHPGRPIISDHPDHSGDIEMVPADTKAPRCDPGREHAQTESPVWDPQPLLPPETEAFDGNDAKDPEWRQEAEQIPLPEWSAFSPSWEEPVGRAPEAPDDFPARNPGIQPDTESGYGPEWSGEPAGGSSSTAFTACRRAEGIEQNQEAQKDINKMDERRMDEQKREEGDPGCGNEGMEWEEPVICLPFAHRLLTESESAALHTPLPEWSQQNGVEQ